MQIIWLLSCFVSARKELSFVIYDSVALDAISPSVHIASSFAVLLYRTHWIIPDKINLCYDKLEGVLKVLSFCIV